MKSALTWILVGYSIVMTWTVIDYTMKISRLEKQNCCNAINCELIGYYHNQILFACDKKLEGE